MTFSNYTLAGHVFFGGGVEVSPGNWRIAAMYGRLRKPVEFSLTDTLQDSNASYKRVGYGLKIGYDKNGDTASASIFTAKDDASSIPFVLPESQLRPMQNLAISLTGRKQFFKRFFVDAEYGISVMNMNINSNTADNDSVAFKPTDNLIKKLLPENSTNRYYDAVNSSFGYNGNWYAIQLRYERIAPEYQTLGSYFFNSDLQNITIIPSLRILKNTLQLSGNVGIQRNNLDNIRASTTKRFVGSANANYIPNEKWNLTATYSNFSSFTNVRPQSDPNFSNSLDTLNFYQVSETMSGSAVRMLGKKENPQSFMINVSYQQANNETGYEGGNQTSKFVNTNFSYSYSIVPSNMVLTATTNIYSTKAANTKSIFYGPTVSITKSFFEKMLRGSWASSYNKTISNNISTGGVLANRLIINYTPSGKEGSSSENNFSLSINILKRFQSTESQPSFSEFTATLNYSYAF